MPSVGKVIQITGSPPSSEAGLCTDGFDNDCDGFTDCADSSDCSADPACVICPDADGDGFEDAACGGLDCNDADPNVNPNVAEVCGDFIDNDCDGLTDGDDPDCQVSCLPSGWPCSDHTDCCSNKCTGGRGGKICK